EPLFLGICLAGFYSYQSWVRNKQILWLIVSGFLFSLAVLTRYVGVILVPWVGLFVWFVSENSINTKFKNVAAFLSPSIIVPSWLLRNHLVAGNVANRELGINPITREHWVSLEKTLRSLIYPNEISLALSHITYLLLLVGCLFVGYWLWKRDYFRSFFSCSLLLFTSALVYLGFVIFSLLYIDSQIPFDFRMLMPMTVFLQLAFFLFLFQVSAIFLGKNWYLSLLGYVFVSWNIAHGYRYSKWFAEQSRFGLYESYRQKNDAIIDEIKKLPPHTKLFSVGDHNIRFAWYSKRPIQTSNFMKLEQPGTRMVWICLDGCDKKNLAFEPKEFVLFPSGKLAWVTR
ncbi:MAG: hypothetical protein NZ108_03070, partial [Bacteroidia bacterium]|nr:hypothetical protein [Bacteroidia bacterium]